MPTVADIAADLAAEHEDLDRILEALDASDWARTTPSPGWTVADQVGHLAYFDRTAALAITDRDAFKAHAAEMLALLGDSGADPTLTEPRSMSPDRLLEWWRDGRRALTDAAATLDDAARLAWYGPDMSAKSFLTARLMETWAHAQDIVDTVGLSRTSTDRLRHIAQLGVITRGWSYMNRGLEPDTTPVFVSLAAPSGDTWTWDEPDAASSITGSAEDFCQVVTQRRNVGDTGLVVVGDAAAEWMRLAQAFAGGATDGPAEGTFT